jgi:hypothetical protein
MARSRFSVKIVRDLAPVLIPLVTRVAVPLAIRSMRRGDGLGDALGEARDRFDKNVKKTRSDFDEVRQEAVDRGRQLYDEALKHGAELIELISSKGLGAAQGWAQTIGKPKRRFPWGKLLTAAAVIGVGCLYLTRD